MKIDVIVEEFFSPDQVKELGLKAEEYGVRGLWTSNYLSSRDPIMNLYPLARASKRIMLGALAVSPWEQHPLKLLNALNTLNEASDGRAMIHLSGGGGDWWMGTGIEPYKRVRAVSETAQILKGGTPGKPMNFNGKLFRARNHNPVWVKYPPPFVYIASMKPQMLRMAGKVGDGMMMSDIPACLIPPLFEILDASRKEAGRDDESFAYSNFWAWHVKADREAAYREARRELILRGWLQPIWLEPFLDADEVQLVQDRKYDFMAAWQQGSGEIPDFPEDIINKMIHGITATGDLDEMDRIIEQFKEFERVGVTEVAIRIHDDPMDALEIIGERLIPALNQNAGQW